MISKVGKERKWMTGRSGLVMEMVAEWRQLKRGD